MKGLVVLQITDDSETILPLDCADAEKIYSHLTRLIKERDDYAEVSLSVQVHTV